MKTTKSAQKGGHDDDGAPSSTPTTASTTTRLSRPSIPDAPVVDFSALVKDHPGIKAGRAAAAAASEAVESMQPWRGKDEWRFKMLRLKRKHTEEEKNDRAARRLGFPTNSVALALPYNTVSESSLDARSMEQRSQDHRASAAAVGGEAEGLKEDAQRLKILPKCFWSMGKSFHAGKSDGYFIQMEMEHARRFPNGDDRLAQKLQEHRNNHVRDHRWGTYGLVAWSLPLPFILGTQSGRWRTDKFLALSYFLGCPIIDRTNILNNQLGIRLINLHPIPQRNSFFDKSLDTIMRQRARDALQRCRARSNKRIYLLWSGGIDTTAMICAFLRVVEDEEAEARRLLVVRYAERSIAEHPAFFRDVISHLQHEEIRGHVRDVFDIPEDAKTERDIPLVVTGDPADMLFGTFRMADALSSGKSAYSLETPWEDVVPRLLHERRLLLNATDYFSGAGRPKVTSKSAFKSAAREWVEWIRPQINAAPIPIVTMFDWWWWITYSCKYNHDVHRVFYNRDGEVPPQLRNRVFNFYESNDFHQYSFANHDQKMKNLRLWATYKHPLKEFILSFCKDKGLAKETTTTSSPDRPRNKLLSLLFGKSESTTTTDTIPEKVDDHTVYYLCKIKVPSVANSFGMEVGLDSEWNVIKFGAASISFSRFEDEFGRGENNLLRKAFLLPSGMLRYQADQLWARGQFQDAKSKYSSASLRGLSCSDETTSCDRALRRKSKAKEPKFKFDEGQLRHRQVRGVVTHLNWRDQNQPLPPTLWAYAQGGAGE